MPSPPRSPAAPEQHRRPAETASVPELRHLAQDAAMRFFLSEEDAGLVGLAVTEAATNAVLHAFVDREPGSVTLTVEPEDGQIAFCVRDDGRGLTPRIDSPGLGLGISLLGRLCARFDVRLGPEGTGTEVRMVFAAPGLELDARAARRRARLAEPLGGCTDAVAVAASPGP